MDEMLEPTPAPTAKTGNRRSVMLGAVLGAVALAGTIVGVSTVAGAQDEPTETESAEAAESEGHDFAGDIFFDDEEWEAFDQCIDEQLGDFEESDFTTEPTDEEWAAIEAAWDAADAACSDLLPEEAKAEMEAWEAFDDCLADAGVLDEDFGAMVHIESGDGFQVAQFGDATGSVTITGDANGVSVTTDGGVTLLDEAALDAEWEAIDAAHSACEEFLPEDLFDEEIFFDDGLFDDEDLFDHEG